jgi:hypothetical protein
VINIRVRRAVVRYDFISQWSFFQYLCRRVATTSLAASKEEAIMTIAIPAPLNK